MAIYEYLIAHRDSSSGRGLGIGDIVDIKPEGFNWTVTEKPHVVKIDTTKANCDLWCGKDYKTDTVLTKRTFSKGHYDYEPDFSDTYFSKPTFVQNLLVDGRDFVEVEGYLKLLKQARKYKYNGTPDADTIKTIVEADIIAK